MNEKYVTLVILFTDKIKLCYLFIKSYKLQKMKNIHIKVTLKIMAVALVITVVASCNSKQTPESIAQQWCDLNSKVYKAAEGPDKEVATEARKSFEKEMETKYKDDKAMMDGIMKAVEACEDASEGKVSEVAIPTIPADATPQSIADQWCELMRLEFRAKNEGDADKIKAAADAVTLFQKNIETKYPEKAMIDNILAAMASCDAALEGKKK